MLPFLNLDLGSWQSVSEQDKLPATPQDVQEHAMDEKARGRSRPSTQEIRRATHPRWAETSPVRRTSFLGLPS